MRFVVFGAGAIGGVVGARLHQAGFDVELIARGAHREAIAERGLTLRTPAEEVTLPIAVHATPATVRLRAGDVVLLAVKGQDTVGALDALSACGPVADSLPIVCLQNGVANEETALRRFPLVYAVPVMSPTAHLEPGAVEASSIPVTGILDIGRYPAGVDATCEAIADVFNRSTFVSEVRADVMRWKWAKLVMNLGNVVQAVCAPSEAAIELVRRARREAVTIMRETGVDFASSEEDAARRGDILQPQPIAGRPRAGGSTWQSLARGAPTLETDFLNGEIVLRARLHGRDAPVNALLQVVGRDAAIRRAEPESVDAESLLAAVDAIDAGAPPRV